MHFDKDSMIPRICRIGPSKQYVRVLSVDFTICPGGWTGRAGLRRGGRVTRLRVEEGREGHKTEG
jgi:hypothetical protein